MKSESFSIEISPLNYAQQLFFPELIQHNLFKTLLPWPNSESTMLYPNKNIQVIEKIIIHAHYYSTQSVYFHLNTFLSNHLQTLYAKQGIMYTNRFVCTEEYWPKLGYYRIQRSSCASISLSKTIFNDIIQGSHLWSPLSSFAIKKQVWQKKKNENGTNKYKKKTSSLVF